jgi:hypothetical protein
MTFTHTGSPHSRLTAGTGGAGITATTSAGLLSTGGVYVHFGVATPTGVPAYARPPA